MVVEICRTLERAPEPSFSPTTSQTPAGRSGMRLRPSLMVRISGRDLEEEFISDSVVSLQIDDTSRGLSRAELVIQNDRQRFTDHELLEGRNLTVEVFTGYENTKFVKRGTYLATVPKYAFMNAAMPHIKLVGYSQEWPLSVNEERRIYANLRDSQIAEEIARRYGLEAIVEQTPIIHEHVAQFNQTDMEFLENRALLHGYDVYVEENTLHFHAPRFDHSGINLVFGAGEQSVFESFEVCIDPWIKGSLWTKSGVDRVTGKEYEFRSTGTEADDITQRMIDRARGKFIRAATLAEVNDETPRRYIVGDGHEQSEEEARRQVESYAKATEWITQGSGRLRGVELLRSRQVVTIVGLNHLSGDYYVSRTNHRIAAGEGYTMEIEVLRPGKSELADRFRGQALRSRERRDVTSNSSVVNTAEAA